MTASRRARSDDDGGAGFAGASGATLRGALLVAVAVLVGVVLLGKGFDTGFLPSTGGTSNEAADDEDDDEGGSDGETDGTTTSTTAPPTTHVPAQVRVVVLNGGGPAGAAGTSSTALAAANFTALEPGNTEPPVTTTTVYYVEGFQADAAVVAGTLGITAVPQVLPPTPPAGTPAAGEVEVVVVLGPDFTPVG